MSIGRLPSNEFLKVSETLTIIPAERRIRDITDVRWYEVQVAPHTRTARIIACNELGETISALETTLVNNSTFKLVITEAGTIVFSSETQFKKSSSEEISLQTRIGETEVNLTGRMSDPTSLRRTDNAVTPSQRLPPHWLSLHETVTTLALALKVRATDGKSWGCTSCLIFLAGDAIAVGGCAAEPNPGICAAAVTGFAVFTANCEGACA